MTEMTLAAARAKHAELGAIIAALMARPTTTISIDAIEIELFEGEAYAGAVLNADGSLKHHLVLKVDIPDGDVTWQNAMKWAESIGGSLPDRQESALLYANCKAHFSPAWYWTCEEHSNASYAWYCDFNYGDQLVSGKSYAGSARAVRRLNP